MSKLNIFIITSILAASLLMSFFAGFIFQELTENTGNTEKKFWERVVIIKTDNFTQTESLSIPFLNISENIVIDFYSAEINSSYIKSIALREYLPQNTILYILFEEKTYIDYFVVKQ